MCWYCTAHMMHYHLLLLGGDPALAHSIAHCLLTPCSEPPCCPERYKFWGRSLSDNLSLYTSRKEEEDKGHIAIQETFSAKTSSVEHNPSSTGGLREPAPSFRVSVPEGIVGDVTFLLLFAPLLTVLVLQLDCEPQRCVDGPPRSNSIVFRGAIIKGRRQPLRAPVFISEAFKY